MKPLFESEAQVAPARGVELAPAPVTAVPPQVVGGKTLPMVPSASAIQPVREEEIAQLGAIASSGLASVPNKMLQHVRVSDVDGFGTELTKLVGVAKGLDPKGLEGKGLMSRIQNMFSSTKERLLGQYRTAEQQMDELVAQLTKKASQQSARVADLEQLYLENMNYHGQLEQAVAHGATLVERLNAQLAAESAATDSFGAQRLADVQRLISRTEKRMDDLRRAMLLAKQTAPQIRMMQDNARGLVEKFGDIQTVTVPAWKSAFSLYLMHLEQKSAVALATAADDATDAALRQGADMLRQNVGDVARARNRSAISIETLEHVQQQLLGSVDDAQRIEAEGRAARAQAAPRLLELEQELVTRFTPGQR